MSDEKKIVLVVGKDSTFTQKLREIFGPQIKALVGVEDPGRPITLTEIMIRAQVTQPKCPRPSCRCNCGYKCGGPGRCKLPGMECLAQEKGHFEKDCDHIFDGPVWVSGDRRASSVTCSKCPEIAMYHDMRNGP